jgi:proteasome accessory factor B
MQRLDRLERITDLLLVLLDTPRPLSLREIAHRVPGYPDSHGARRQAFERDKRLLRDEGVPVLVVTIGGEDQLGYRVDPDAYYLPDLGLEAEEQAALNLAVAGVHLGEPIGHQALLKLGAGGESPLRESPVPLVDLPSFDGLAALPALFDAIRIKAVVDFGYRGESRHVDVAGRPVRSRPRDQLGVVPGSASAPATGT